MMISNIEIITGLVDRDRFGSWDDCDPGLYIDDSKLETIFNKYRNKTIKITIEIISEDGE